MTRWYPFTTFIPLIQCKVRPPLGRCTKIVLRAPISRVIGLLDQYDVLNFNEEGRSETIENSMLNVSDCFMQFILTLILYVGILALGAYYGHHPKSFGNDFLTMLSGDVTKHILMINPQFILEGPCPLFSCLLVSTPWTSLWGVRPRSIFSQTPLGVASSAAPYLVRFPLVETWTSNMHIDWSFQPCI